MVQAVGVEGISPALPEKLVTQCPSGNQGLTPLRSRVEPMRKERRRSRPRPNRAEMCLLCMNMLFLSKQPHAVGEWCTVNYCVGGSQKAHETLIT